MEKLTVKDFGTTEKGQKALLYTMKNDAGTSVSVSDYGAALVSLFVRGKDGNPVDVVLGYDNVTGYEKGGDSIGATVGRNANRIGGASIEINGVTYELDKNDNGNNLHSGYDYYNKRFWDVAENADDHVTFRLHSPDKDQGYPGALDMYVTYTLDEDSMLTIHYEAVPDKDTVINMTNHSYFNLNGHDSGTVLNHSVTLDAESFTPADRESIPTGEIRSVDGTPMDYHFIEIMGCPGGCVNGGGYDHNWVLKNEGRFDKVAEVTADRSGIRMEVYTDLPGVQMYTANFLNGEPGKEGALYGKRSAVCLETQYFPDAIHHDNFPGPVCRAGEKYDTRTAYRFVPCE